MQLSSMTSTRVGWSTTPPTAMRSRPAWRRARSPSTAASTPPPTASTSATCSACSCSAASSDAGHRALALAGGATGMIGDPSGRSEERNLLDADHARDQPRPPSGLQIARVLGPGDRWELVDNATWTAPITFLDFLRDVGKHVTVNQMVARESVRVAHVERAGISFTEFSYMLLQAHDFGGSHRTGAASSRWAARTSGETSPPGSTWSAARGAGPVHGLSWPLLTARGRHQVRQVHRGRDVWLDPSAPRPTASSSSGCRPTTPTSSVSCSSSRCCPLERSRESWRPTPARHRAAAPSGPGPARSPPWSTARRPRPADAASRCSSVARPAMPAKPCLRSWSTRFPRCAWPRDELAAGRRARRAARAQRALRLQGRGPPDARQGGGYGNDDDSQRTPASARQTCCTAATSCCVEAQGLRARGRRRWVRRCAKGHISWDLATSCAVT